MRFSSASAASWRDSAVSFSVIRAVADSHSSEPARDRQRHDQEAYRQGGEAPEPPRAALLFACGDRRG